MSPDYFSNSNRVGYDVHLVNTSADILDVDELKVPSE
nr:MAG TPA: hypothetical protein [Caudoviricetes sp.]